MHHFTTSPQVGRYLTGFDNLLPHSAKNLSKGATLRSLQEKVEKGRKRSCPVSIRKIDAFFTEPFAVASVVMLGMNKEFAS